MQIIAGALFVVMGLQQAMAADTLKIDPKHSNVTFTIRHILAEVTGRFTEFHGNIMYDTGAPQNLSAEMEVRASSINTDNVRRDGHLRSSDFFAVDSFPTLSFRSTNASKTDNGLYLDGILTIRGVAKPVSVPVEVLGVVQMEEGKMAAFKSTFKINRKDFGIFWNRTLDYGGTLLGDEVTIHLQFEASSSSD